MTVSDNFNHSFLRNVYIVNNFLYSMLEEEEVIGGDDGCKTTAQAII